MGILKSLNQRWQLFRSRNQPPVKRIISFWEQGGVDFDYYKKAEGDVWINPFWVDDGVFYKLFRQLNIEATLELASGSGRHAAKIISNVKHLWLLDTSKGALEIARNRFKDFSHVSYIHSADGMGIKPSEMADETVTAVFSYDAMVHFEPECVKQYVVDAYRVLKPGGKALFHHSNYTKNKNGVFSDNPGWRNYMSQELFATYAREAGFIVVDSQLISWVEPDSDCVTLLQKPA